MLVMCYESCFLEEDLIFTSWKILWLPYGDTDKDSVLSFGPFRTNFNEFSVKTAFSIQENALKMSYKNVGKMVDKFCSGLNLSS